MAAKRSNRSVIWMRPVRGARGPEPSRDRDAIARAAVAIADREGLGAVSMRRLAADLGAGTSSLYRYFARKDDLLNLMVDAALVGGDLVPSSGDVRADLARIATEMRALFKAHPWLATALAGRPTLGPNRLRALETFLARLGEAGIGGRDSLVVIDALTSYVRGFVASELADVLAIRESGLTARAWRADQAAYFESIRRSGDYPLATRLFEELADAGDRIQDRGFEAGLALLLDGVAQRLGIPAPRRASRRSAIST